MENKTTKNQKLRKELIAMMDEDQKTGKAHDWKKHFKVVRKKIQKD